MQELQNGQNHKKHNVKQFEKIMEENCQLRDCIKEMNILMMSLNEKNNTLQSKLDEAQKEHERRVAK